MKRLCTICARAGSKGVKNKNIRLLLGKPLISYSIQQAKATKIFDSIAVSSDSDEILNISENYGVDYLIRRPDKLATDEALGVWVATLKSQMAVRNDLKGLAPKSLLPYRGLVELREAFFAR